MGGFESRGLYEETKTRLGNDFYQKITNDEISTIIVLPDLADADGFSSQIIWNEFLETMNQLTGKPEDFFIEPVMNLKTGHGSNLESLINYYSSNTKKPWFVFADIGSSLINPIQELTNNRSTILDHHTPSNKENNHHHLIPQLFNINGEKELSGSILSFELVSELLKRLKKTIITKEQAKRINNTINKIIIYSLTGASADQQEIKGRNKEIIESLLNRKGGSYLKEVNSPFYGYYTKTLPKVLAEASNPRINMKFLGSETGGSSIAGYKKNNFINWTDDYKAHGLRTMIATRFLNEIFVSIAEKEGLSLDDIVTREGLKKIGRMRNRIAELTQSQLTREGTELLKRIVSKNIELYYDPHEKERMLNKMNKKQYLIVSPDDPMINGITINEAANLLTAVSKMRGRDYYIRAINNDSEAINITKQLKKAYNRVVWSGMRMIEEKLLEEKSIIRINPLITYLRLDDLKGLFEEAIKEYDLPADIKLELPTITGVLGGLAINNRLVEGEYGILLTGIKTSDGKIKISARMSDIDYFNNVHLGELMSGVSGGGHRLAAAAMISVNEEKDFLEYFKEKTKGLYYDRS